MHLRLQSYLPFDVQVCMNGREWLARQLLQQGVGFERADNCFTRLDAPELAQQLLDEQLRTAWPATLDALLKCIHPLHEEIFRDSPMKYWWVAYQTEWATDLLFGEDNLRQRLAFLKRDPWQGFFEIRQRLPQSAVPAVGKKSRRRRSRMKASR